MAGMDIITVVLGIIFFSFLNSMQRSAKHLVPFYFNLNMICFNIGTVYFVCWIVYLGYTYYWYTPIVLLFVIFLFNSTAMVILEYSVSRIFHVDYDITDWAIGVAGIIGVPICMVLTLFYT